MTTSTVTQDRVTWTHIGMPTAQDIRQLAGRYPQLHPLNLQDCLNEQEHPKLDHYDSYLFMVFQFPVWNAELGLYRPAEMDVFLASGMLVTVQRGELLAINDLFKRVQGDEAVRAQFLERGASQLLYSLLNALVDTCFPILSEVRRRLRQVELSLSAAHPALPVQEIAQLRRDLIALRHIVQPQIAVVSELAHGGWPFLHEDLDLYWSDVANHLEQVRSALEEDLEVVGGLSATLDSLASQRIVQAARLLAAAVLLALPLTLLGLCLGTNLLLPAVLREPVSNHAAYVVLPAYSEYPALFFPLLFLSLAAAGGLLWYLHRRGWL